MKHMAILFLFMSIDDWNRTWCFSLLVRGNILFGDKKLFVKTAEPFNQLRSVKISLCVEANIWTQEKGDDQCSVSLSVFSLIPQDNSVSAPTPSLLSHAWICLSLSLCLLSQILLTLTPLTLCLPFFLSSSSQTPLFSCLFFFFFLQSSISPSGLLCLLFVSFSSNGGWRRVSPSRLVQSCCGNNSCHFIVQKLTEKNERSSRVKACKTQTVSKFGCIFP